MGNLERKTREVSKSHHAFMTKRGSFTGQTVYKTHMEIKKRTTVCVLYMYIIIFSFHLIPSSHGTDQNTGNAWTKEPASTVNAIF